MILEGKVVIVSGIGPGLGQALAMVAATEGANLAICARTAAKLDELADRIEGLGLGTDVIKVPTDIQQTDQCKRLVDATLERFGRIDILINSAYITGDYVAADVADLADWRQTMEVNLFGTMNLIQQTVPHMKQAGGGSIVNVNTKIARMPHENLGGYAVSKAALRMATTQLAKELGGFHIRVNSVFPGWMWGPTVKEGFAAEAAQRNIPIEEVRAEIAALLPLGEIPEDGECAKSVVALASDYFTATTGACLDLSAGEYMPV